MRPARYKGARGGRAAAKSHFFAGLLVEETLRRHVRAACVREVQRSLKESAQRLIENKIHEFGASGDFRILESRIEGPHGSEYLFEGMQNHTADSFKSIEGLNILWAEEANRLSHRSLTIMLPTVQRNPGAEMWFSWNPRLPSDPVDRMFREAPAGPDWSCVHVTYRDNPWLEPGILRDINRDRERDPDKYAHVWLGEYERNTEARVFRNWRIADRLHDAVCFDPPAGTRFFYGADFGFSVDPTVGVRVFIVGRNLYLDREVYRVGCEIDHTPALFDRLDNRQARRWPCLADSARPETISYMQRNGYPRMKPARKGPGSVEEGVAFLQNFDAIVIHPDCQNAIDEFTLYSYKVDRLTEEVLPVLEDKHNNVIDAVRYAVENLRTGARYDDSLGWVAG